MMSPYLPPAHLSEQHVTVAPALRCFASEAARPAAGNSLVAELRCRQQPQAVLGRQDGSSH